jgi:FkbM family methyltransferase
LHHRLLSRFRTFHGDLPPGFEAWFFGVKVRDWLFTGVSKQLKGGHVAVGLPPVNSEYFEWIGLMAALLSADSHFTMVELGAGWGRWLVAAARLADQRQLPFTLVGVEADPAHFQWMRDVFSDNGLDPDAHRLLPVAVAPETGSTFFRSHADPAAQYGQRIVSRSERRLWRQQPGCRTIQVESQTLERILQPLDRVDLLSVDIQGAELDVLTPAMPVLRQKVRVLQVSTHGSQIDAGLNSVLKSHAWSNIFCFPAQTEARTPHGPVRFDEGLQTWLNPDETAAQAFFEDPACEASPGYPISGVPANLPEGGGGVAVFDSEAAVRINEARLAHLDSLGLAIDGKTVLDVGCGVGHLAQFFAKRNCAVVCVDAREENIASLRSRYPSLAAHAHVMNVESDPLDRLGRFDIVFCYGLLYHLENPLAALRNMASVCQDLLLLETVVTDHPEPLLRLVDEPSETVNQAVATLAVRPSPAFVAMALNRVGFPFVYGTGTRPQHPDFRFEWESDLDWSRAGHLLRCIFVASRRELDHPELDLLLHGEAARNEAALSSGKTRGAAPITIYAGGR